MKKQEKPMSNIELIWEFKWYCLGIIIFLLIGGVIFVSKGLAVALISGSKSLIAIPQRQHKKLFTSSQ